MKTNNKNITIISIVCFILLFISCKKEQISSSELSSLNVANAVIGGGVVRLNSNLRDSALVMDYKYFSLNAGPLIQVKAYQSKTPNTPYFNKQIELLNGDIYSLFLTGTVSTPDYLFVKDKIAPFASQDVLRIRVINLSPSNIPINVTQNSNATNNIFSNVTFKQLTEFVELQFPLTLPSGANVFQFKNSSGTVLATYTMPASGKVSTTVSRRKSITLIFKGISGGSGTDSFGVIAQANY